MPRPDVGPAVPRLVRRRRPQLARSASMDSSDQAAKLIVHGRDPLNAEPPLDLLRRSFLTPNDLFVVRNPAPIPEVDAGA